LILQKSFGVSGCVGCIGCNTGDTGILYHKTDSEREQAEGYP
jgi:hypothetical protein